MRDKEKKNKGERTRDVEGEREWRENKRGRETERQTEGVKGLRERRGKEKGVKRDVLYALILKCK